MVFIVLKRETDFSESFIWYLNYKALKNRTAVLESEAVGTVLGTKPLPHLQSLFGGTLGFLRIQFENH